MCWQLWCIKLSAFHSHLSINTSYEEFISFEVFFLLVHFQINQLNDSHAQLMVHWLGEGTNVMLCLAREPPPGPTEEVKTTAVPSSVYISYNNGDTFDDKTYMFQLRDADNKTVNSTLDQFSTNPTYNSVSSRAIRTLNCINLDQFKKDVEIYIQVHSVSKRYSRKRREGEYKKKSVLKLS